jgi:hypothetical protein
VSYGGVTSHSRRLSKCDGCGRDFQGGDKIDVVREATAVFNRFTNVCGYRLSAKRPLAVFHVGCTPRP